jgi:hypothetical protein
VANTAKIDKINAEGTDDLAIQESRRLERADQIRAKEAEQGRRDFLQEKLDEKNKTKGMIGTAVDAIKADSEQGQNQVAKFEARKAQQKKTMPQMLKTDTAIDNKTLDSLKDIPGGSRVATDAEVEMAIKTSALRQQNRATLEAKLYERDKQNQRADRAEEIKVESQNRIDKFEERQAKQEAPKLKPQLKANQAQTPKLETLATGLEDIAEKPQQDADAVVMAEGKPMPVSQDLSVKPQADTQVKAVKPDDAELVDASVSKGDLAVAERAEDAIRTEAKQSLIDEFNNTGSIIVEREGKSSYILTTSAKNKNDIQFTMIGADKIPNGDTRYDNTKAGIEKAINDNFQDLAPEDTRLAIKDAMANTKKAWKAEHAAKKTIPQTKAVSKFRKKNKKRLKPKLKQEKMFEKDNDFSLFSEKGVDQEKARQAKLDTDARAEQAEKDQGKLVLEPKLKATKAEADTTPTVLRGLENDISLAEATSSRSGISFDPEKRGKQIVSDHIEGMKEEYAKLQKLVKTPEQQEILDTEFARYRDGMVKRTRTKLERDSRVMSTMITGAGNFPAASQRKKSDSAHKALNDLVEFDKKVIGKIRSKLLGTEAVKSTDVNALTKLETKLGKLEKNQELMRSANKLVRSKKLTYDQKVSGMQELGLSESNSRALLTPDYAGRLGFASYQLTNNNAKIKATKDRIASVSSLQADARDIGTTAKEFDGGKVEVNREDQRIRFLFDAKPDAETRAVLKRNSFRWSPKNEAWQTQLTRNGEARAENVAKELGIKFEADQPPAKAPLKTMPTMLKAEAKVEPIEEGPVLAQSKFEVKADRQESANKGVSIAGEATIKLKAMIKANKEKLIAQGVKAVEDRFGEQDVKPKTVPGAVKTGIKLSEKDTKKQDVAKGNKLIEDKYGEQTKPAKTLRGLLSTQRKLAEKEIKEKGITRSLTDAMDSSLSALSKQYGQKPSKWINELETIGSKLDETNKALAGKADNVRDEMIQAKLIEIFTDKRYGSVRRATRGDRVKTWKALEAKIQEHLSKAYARDIENMMSRNDLPKMWVDDSGNVPVRSSDLWNDKLAEIGIGVNRDDVQLKLDKLKNAKSKVTWLRGKKATNDIIEQAIATRNELQKQLRDSIASHDWHDLKRLSNELKSIDVKSRDMLDQVSRKNTMRKADIAVNAIADLEPVKELKNQGEKGRRGILKHALNDWGDSPFGRALSVAGGKAKSVIMDVLYSGLNDGVDARNTAEVKHMKNLAEVQKSLGMSQGNIRKLRHGKFSKTINGKKRVFTTAQIMNLYAMTLDRDGHNPVDASGKEIEGGYNILTRNAFHTDFSKGHKMAEDMIQGKNYAENQAIIDDLLGRLTDNQKKLVEWAVNDVTKYGQIEGNKASRKLYGRDTFFSDSHWGLDVERLNAKDNVDGTDSVKNYKDARIENSGFLKQRIDHHNPFIVGDFFAKYESQIKNMSNFIHMTSPSIDALSLLENDTFSTMLDKRFGKEFDKRTRTVISIESGMRHYGMDSDRLSKTIGSLNRAGIAGILSWMQTSKWANRLSGSEIAISELAKMDMNLALAYRKEMMRPVLRLPGTFKFSSKEFNRIRDILLDDGYFYKRWVQDPIRVMTNVSMDSRISETSNAVQAGYRRLQEQGLKGMASAEMMNAINMYTVLENRGMSRDDVLYETRRITKRTQNPSDAMDHSGFYSDTRENKILGTITPLLGQPGIVSEYQRNALKEANYARRVGEGERKAYKNLLLSMMGVQSSIATQTLIRRAVRMASTGAIASAGLAALLTGGDDDDKDWIDVQENKWMLSGLIKEQVQNIVPWATNLYDLIESGWKGRFSVDTVLSSNFNNLVRGHKKLLKGIEEKDDDAIRRGLVQTITGLTAIGVPAGGVSQATKVVLGSMGLPATGKLSTKRKKRTKRTIPRQIPY